MLTATELKTYSLSHGLRQLANGERCLEREISDEIAKRSGASLNDTQLMLPWQALAKHSRRDMTAAGVSGSQFLVATEQGPAELALAPASAVLRAGARVLPNLQGDITIPISAGETCYWIPDEGTEATKSQPTMRQASMMPKHVVALVQTTHKFQTQAKASGVDVDAFLAADLVRSIGRAVDTACIQGTGTSGQPHGLVGTTGIKAVDSGTSLSWGDICGLISDLGDEDAERLTFIGAPTTKKVLANRARLSSGSFAIWHDDKIDQHPAIARTACPDAGLAVGAWDQLVIGMWREGIVVSINPFSDFSRGYSMHRAWLMMDLSFLRPEMFGYVGSIT